jgi:hypothetical protein
MFGIDFQFQPLNPLKRADGEISPVFVAGESAERIRLGRIHE